MKDNMKQSVIVSMLLLGALIPSTLLSKEVYQLVQDRREVV